jgi:GT2 family glycosyltransferase
LNPDLADPSQWNLKTVAYKSGDIMLLDRESWNKIKGFPENDVWVHSDLVVCTVARNNGFSLVVDPAVKIYTYPQERTVVEREFELLKSYDYLLRLDCN